MSRAVPNDDLRLGNLYDLRLAGRDHRRFRTYAYAGRRGAGRLLLWRDRASGKRFEVVRDEILEGPYLMRLVRARDGDRLERVAS